MAFPRSQRFVEKERCVPPPTAYHLPSAFEENNCSTWGKPCTFDHQYSSQHLAYGKNNDLYIQNNKSIDQVPSASCTKHRDAVSCDADVNNKQNILCCVQRKDDNMSNSFRSKKSLNSKLTEPKAPSFMTRPRHSTHNCFANGADEIEKENFSTGHFNRQSFKRKSVKLVKENKLKSNKNVEETLSSPFRVEIIPNVQDNRQLNVSYVIRSKSNEQVEDKSLACCIPTKSTTSPSAIPKRLSNITDDMKKCESLQNLDLSVSEDTTGCTNYQPNSNLEVGSLIEDEILENDDSLEKEYLNNFHATNLSSNDLNILENATSNALKSSENFAEKLVNKTIMDNEETENESELNKGTENLGNTSKSHDLSSDIESHVVFLIADEFIDDEYDSYINEITLDKTYRDDAASNLFQIYKSLIHMDKRKQTINVPKRKVVLKVKHQSGLGKVAKTRETAAMLKKKKKTDHQTNVLWSEIVRAAITDLKGEFKNEIYKKTNEKVHAIMSNLAKVLLKAEDDIDESCERTTVALINNLEKMVTN